jgi:GNAT superfamily N-acetyltransferase
MIKEGHLLGYIVGSVVENLPTLLPEKHGYVGDLAVDAHGKVGGIGRNLFEALKGWFRDRGVTHVEARVPYRHAVAQAFWRALGATEWYEHLWLKLE